MTAHSSGRHRLSQPVPKRLREARVARGKTTTELAEAIGVSKQLISKYELGHSAPSGAILAMIIELLNLPLSFFCSPVPQDASAGVAYFRSLKSATKKTREMVGIRARWVQRIVSYLEQYLNFPKVNLPDYEKLIHDKTLEKDDIEEIASFVRKEWGLGLGPISDLCLLLEKQGIVLIRIDFDDLKTDAFSQWYGERPFIFLGSDKDSAVRSRFDAAHELGHLLLHLWVDSEQLSDRNIFDRIEKEANLFAGAFLLPKETFSQEVMSTSLDHFLSLKKRWKVSIAAMIYRCEELGILSPSQVLYLRKQISRLKIRTREPLDDVLPPENPRLLKQAITMLIENGVVTVAGLIDSIKLLPNEIEELCNLPKGMLSTERKVISLRIKDDRQR